MATKLQAAPVRRRVKKEPSLTPEELKAKVVGALRSLGDSPNKIANKLAKLGIVGEREESDRCPIAFFIRSHAPGKSITVCSDEIEITNGEEISITPPAAVTRFVEQFDNGKFPELELHADRG